MERIEGRKRIALFGGTFDPVHLGHLAIAKAAVEKVDLDEVIFLPCKQSPHKTGQASATGEQRVRMLEMMTRDFPWAKVDGWELEQPPPSYSWKTARHFRQRFPDDQLFWLMGTDQWKTLESWNRPDELASLVSFIVHAREGERLEKSRFEAIFLEGDHPASATGIRYCLAKGEAIPSGWLDEETESYLRREKIYAD